MLNEWQSKEILRQAGVPVPKGIFCPDIGVVAENLRSLEFPVVVKGCGDNIAHKSELGAVAVGIDSETRLIEAATDILNIPGITGLIIEEMVTDAVTEVIAGIRRDPVFGLVLTIGAGGTLAELFQDVSTLILPASDVELRETLEQQKVFKLIDGYRGRQKGDFEALLATVQKLAGFCQDNVSDIIEVEINPIMVRPEGMGVVAVDALVTVVAEDS